MTIVASLPLLHHDHCTVSGMLNLSLHRLHFELPNLGTSWALAPL